MSILSIPIELVLDIAENLDISDIFSLTITSRRLHTLMIKCLYRKGSRHTVTNAKSLTEGLNNVSFWHDKTGNGTVLEWAAIHDRLSTFKRMLATSDVDAVQSDSYGLTLLHRLAGQGKAEFMQPLMEKLQKDHQDPFAADVSCLTPLHFAAGCGRLEAVTLLINFGADVSAKDRHGNAPLHLAAVTGSLVVFNSLVNAGADVNSETRFGWTAIDQASIGHQYISVEELLRLGARPPRWQEKRYALNQYVRLSPCPLEYSFQDADFT